MTSNWLIAAMIVVVIFSTQMPVNASTHHHKCLPPYTMLYSFTSNPQGFCTLLENSNHQPVNASTGQPFTHKVANKCG
jgi:hypothetical protein